MAPGGAAAPAGVGRRAIWERMSVAFDAMQDYTEANLGDLRGNVLPGVHEVLEALRSEGHMLGLLTGNLSRIAWAKLRHAGLAEYFQTGGFGEESEIRSHLVPVALADAALLLDHPVPPRNAALVGDTPLDVEAGKAHATRTVGVATGLVSFDELAASEPDLMLSSFADWKAASAALLSLFT